MMLETQLRNPYVGPRPFETEDIPIFFGRENETDEIVSLVISHRVLLIYAESGVGKTSLLNAGILPRLNEEGFEVLPTARVRGLIPEGLLGEDVSNLYIFNTLVSWLEEGTDLQQLMQITLTGFLRERERPRDEYGLTSPRVVILDQFEELFTFHPERWRDREAFFKQIRDALEEDPLLRVVFVMREDYVPQMDPYVSLLPENLRTRYRLKRIGKEAALMAITEPLKYTNRKFAEGVAASLIEDLMKVQIQTIPEQTIEVVGEFIEPVQLQVVCETLWNELPPFVVEIAQTHLRAFGDVTQALSRYYENCIAVTTSKSGVNEGDLRSWFEKSLITSAKTRGTVFRGDERTGDVTNAAVDTLENMHLIRGEWRSGSRWYELIHDRFIEPIQESNRTWRLARYRARLKKAAVLGTIVSVLLGITAAWLLISSLAKPIEFQVRDLVEIQGRILTEPLEVDNENSDTTVFTNIAARRDFQHNIDISLNSNSISEQDARERIYEFYGISEIDNSKICLVPAEVPSGATYTYTLEWIEILHEGVIEEGRSGGDGQLGTYQILISWNCQVVGVVAQ